MPCFMLLHTIIDWKESWFAFTEKIQNFLQHLAVVSTDVKLSKIFGIYNFICFKICSILGFMHHLMFCIICRIHGVLDENGRTML